MARHMLHGKCQMIYHCFSLTAPNLFDCRDSKNCLYITSLDLFLPEHFALMLKSNQYFTGLVCAQWVESKSVSCYKVPPVPLDISHQFGVASTQRMSQCSMNCWHFHMQGICSDPMPFWLPPTKQSWMLSVLSGMLRILCEERTGASSRS